MNELKEEAKRLFPLAKSRITTPLLKKAKNDTSDNEFNYYNALDQSFGNNIEVCICMFDFKVYRDDFGWDDAGDEKFEKFTQKAEAECNKLANFLNSKTNYTVFVDEDSFAYYIMIKK